MRLSLALPSAAFAFAAALAPIAIACPPAPMQGANPAPTSAPIASPAPAVPNVSAPAAPANEMSPTGANIGASNGSTPSSTSATGYAGSEGAGIRIGTFATPTSYTWGYPSYSYYPSNYYYSYPSYSYYPGYSSSYYYPS